MRNLQEQVKKVFYFSRSLEQFFLTVGQNNFGKKIPYLSEYCISANSFRGSYWFLNLALCTVTLSAETIQGRKLFNGGNYSKKYNIDFGDKSS